MKNLFKISILTAVIAIAMTNCGKDPEEKIPVITITTQPAATTTVTAGSITGSLTVAASVTEGATLSYQWFSATQNSSTGGSTIAGATSATFAIPTSNAPSTYYYFCEVSATGGATSVRSSVATVTVNPSAATLVSIAVTKQPDKLVYIVGETFDPAGMEVEATYSDQSKAKVNNADLTFDYNFLTAGVNKTVIVKYLDKEDRNSVKVTVNEPVPDITLTITGEYVYNGAPIVPQHTVKAGDHTLTTGQDFDLTYGEAGNTNAGEVTVTATGKGTYEGKSDTKTFTIEKFPITVTADDMEKTFWDDDPEFTFTVNPPLFGDDEFTGALEREAGDEVGIYAILQGDLSAGDNYEITFVEGEFEIYYFKGDGTSGNPYKIGSASQLNGLRLTFVNVGGNAEYNSNTVFYQLTENIVLDAYQTGNGWIPIGTQANPFKGNFNGNKKIVSGLKIDNNSINDAGLFGYINGGVMQDLGVVGAVSGNQNVGGVAGRIDGSISNCFTSVAVRGNQNLGGVVGSISNGDITNCYSSGAISGINTSGVNNVGGIAGSVSTGCSVINCYAAGAINANAYVGGVVGMGNVKTSAALNPSIMRPSGNSNLNRVVGLAGGMLSNNVAWEDMTVFISSATTITSNDGSAPHGKDITALQAKDKATYTGMGWLFDGTNPWKMGNAAYPLPVLSWQEESTYPAFPEHLE